MSAVIERIERHLAPAPVSVETVLNYTNKSATKSEEPDARTVRVHNARLFDGIGLDSSGFEHATHRSAFVEWAEFRDKALVEALYYPEVAALVLARSGAREAAVLDHTLGESGVDPAPRRPARELPAAAAAARLHRRFAIVKVWRPIGGPVQQAPLAMCDARSIAPADLMPSARGHRVHAGETHALAYSPLHRWYWYPQQTQDEATLLKIHDSRTDGVARLSAHTAFDDPTGPAAPAPRRSIEVRALLLW